MICDEDHFSFHEPDGIENAAKSFGIDITVHTNPPAATKARSSRYLSSCAPVVLVSLLRHQVVATPPRPQSE
jgi:hypothetical protein